MSVRGMQIVDGLVANIAVFDVLPDGWVLAEPGVGIGWLDNGDGTYSDPAPPPTLAEKKTALVAETRALAEQHITAGYTSDALGTTHTYPSNRDYQLNIIGAAQTGLDRTFLCADSGGVWSRRMHTAAQLQQVCEDGAARMSDIFDAMDAIVASIEAAADQTELDAIDITTGWPA